MRDRFLLVQVTMERRHLHWRDVGKGWEWIDRVNACWQALKSSHVSAGAVGPQRPSILLDSAKGGQWRTLIGLGCSGRHHLHHSVPSSPQRPSELAGIAGSAVRWPPGLGPAGGLSIGLLGQKRRLCLGVCAIDF